MARGPAYPSVNLQEAVELARKLYDYAKRSPVLMDATMKDVWKISPTSSNAGKLSAALKYFGLTEEGNGVEGKKTIKVSDRAYRILVDAEDSPERIQSIRDAALSPRWYLYCWNKWGADVPQAARSHLIFEQKFVESTADEFLKDYKATITFAGITGKDKIQENPASGGESSKNLIKVGDYVQWEALGVLKLPEARRVVSLTDDGFAFVEGSQTGIPVKELQTAEKPVTPTVNKPLRSFGAPEKGMRHEIFSMTEGQVAIEWPAVLSKESFEDFKDWLKILERKIGRSVVGKEPTSDEK